MRHKTSPSFYPHPHRIRFAWKLTHWQKFATHAQAGQTVMDWMGFYNHRRLHSTLDYLSPTQYEQRWYLQLMARQVQRM